MAHISLTIPVADSEQQDILVTWLEQLGFEGFEQLEDHFKAFIEQQAFEMLEQSDWRAYIPSLKELDIKTEVIEETNWNELWEKGYDPLIVDEKVYLRASFHKPRPEIPIELIIDPKMSFGTGHHATTHMMIQMMLKEEFTGQDVLDFGSGTGVLAILAQKLEANRVVAIDHEEWAYNNSMENMSLNDTEQVTVIQGDASVIPNMLFSQVLANVNKSVIFQYLKNLTEHVKPGGLLYLSGLLATDKPETLERCAGEGLELIDSLHEGDWICLKLRKL